MYIYKITNLINGRWYVGKHSGTDLTYMGSGKILKQAYKKYGKENFKKEVIKTCSTLTELNQQEKEFIRQFSQQSPNNSYNLAPGGEGGDLSRFIPYDKIDYSRHKMEGTKKWYASLTQEEKDQYHNKQASSRSKGWYVSKVDDPTEEYVHNISKWCEVHGIDKSVPTSLNNPKSPRFQKQVKGWRIRRSDMPALSPYVDLRNVSRPNTACKGRTWSLVNGKRVWSDK